MFVVREVLRDGRGGPHPFNRRSLRLGQRQPRSNAGGGGVDEMLAHFGDPAIGGHPPAAEFRFKIRQVLVDHARPSTTASIAAEKPVHSACRVARAFWPLAVT